tara:strand:+ start:32782 stop:33834 length:1053 start_codon:yes stop_codon:yes gene_type:complete
MKITALIYLLLMSTLAFAWPRNNNPHTFENDLKTHFYSLPDKASIEQNYIAWPGSHWASHLGGIANRWSASNPQNFSYNKYSKEELKNLEEHLIDELSPAEKYDILMGRYDYPTVRREWRENSPNDTSWFGICHGVAPAALNHPEPLNNTIINDDGIKLNFYSSDVKALLSYQYAKIWKSRVKFIGKRCYAYSRDNIRRRQRSACEDLNPGAFHILFTNFIGLKKKTFIVDIDPLNEVWNHVPKSYYYDVYEEYETRENATPGTKKVLWVGAALSYAAAIAPYFEPVIGLPQGYYVENNYSYLLDLDENDNIIGGEWISDLRPDFIWSQEEVPFKGYWDKLNQVYIPRTE